MKHFYKIENNLPLIGSGIKVPENFIEFEIGKEPKTLKDAIAYEKSLSDKANRIKELKSLLTNSDYWELPTYRADKTNEQNQENDAQRILWRDEVRN
jgi:hypothetical protein